MENSEQYSKEAMQLKNQEIKSQKSMFVTSLFYSLD